MDFLDSVPEFFYRLHVLFFLGLLCEVLQFSLCLIRLRVLQRQLCFLLCHFSARLELARILGTGGKAAWYIKPADVSSAFYVHFLSFDVNLLPELSRNVMSALILIAVECCVVCGQFVCCVILCFVRKCF